MYYEEKIIDGVLCFRGHPKGVFKRMTQEQITKRFLQVKNELKKIKEQNCQPQH